MTYEVVFDVYQRPQSNIESLEVQMAKETYCRDIFQCYIFFIFFILTGTCFVQQLFRKRHGEAYETAQYFSTPRMIIKKQCPL